MTIGATFLRKYAVITILAIKLFFISMNILLHDSRKVAWMSGGQHAASPALPVSHALGHAACLPAAATCSQLLGSLLCRL